MGAIGPSWSRTFSGPLLAAALSLIAAGPVRAADPEDARTRARALLSEASRLYQAQDYQGALGRLGQAYATFPSPVILFNFGLAYRAVGRETEALESFERFLAESPAGDTTSAARRDEASEYVVELRARVSTLEVTVDLDGAEVLVDGKARGTTPLPRPLHLPPGSHRVLVRKAGHQPDDQSVQLGAGERVKVVVRLDHAAAPLAAPEVERPRPPAPPAGAMLIDALPARPDPPPAPLQRRWWFWTSVGVIVLGAAVGTMLALQGQGPDKYCKDCNGGEYRLNSPR